MRLRLPWKGSANERRPARRRPIRLILLVILLLAALPTGWLVWSTQAQQRENTTGATANVSRADLPITVEASGTVMPARSIELPFGTSGQVQEVYVQEGQQVSAGQALVRLDERDLRLELQQAEADLQSALATLAETQGDGATPEEIAQAEAGVRAAQANFEQTRTGNITAADLREAEASVEQARARLEALKQPSNDKVSAAQLAVIEAQSNLDATRDSASAAKTKAEQDMLRAADALTEAQSSYATALQQWQYVQDTGTDPINPTTSDGTQGTTENTLNGNQRQQYYDAYIRAEANMRSAERAVEQAQIAFDSAREQEVVAVPKAEAVLADAQTQLEALLHPGAQAITEAEAGLKQAQAQLDKLRAGGTAAQREQAAAQIAEAQASLQALTAPAAAPDRAKAEAGVAQAQAQVDAARLDLDRATVTAPFTGTIATVDVEPGTVVGASDTAFTLVNTSTIHLDMEIGESDITRLKVGQPVVVEFETIPDRTFTGTISSIATTGEESDGVVTYKVQATFDPGDAPIKLGMTASAQIEVERHANVIQVPNRALTAAGPLKSLQVLYGEQQTPVTILVETGATDGVRTEIVRCVETSTLCLQEGDTIALNTSSSNNALAPNGDTVMVPAGKAMPAGGPKVIRIGP